MSHECDVGRVRVWQSPLIGRTGLKQTCRIMLKESAQGVTESQPDRVLKDLKPQNKILHSTTIRGIRDSTVLGLSTHGEEETLQ